MYGKMGIFFGLVLINIFLGFAKCEEAATCGVQKADSEKSLTVSDSAEIKEFPWVVMLRYEDQNGTNAGYRCLGVLINHKAVITSAGCVEPQEVVLKGVRLGEHHLATDPDCIEKGDKKECADAAKDVGVEKKIAHSGYNSQSRDNDIAVIILDKEVEYSDTIQPICLPKSDLATKPGDTLVATGWGRSTKGELILTKKKVISKVEEIENCEKDYEKTSKSVTKNNICTKEVDNSTHFTCAGDSGGPLAKVVDKVWYLIGITSFGIGCGNTFADGNTKVENYLSWINENSK